MQARFNNQDDMKFKSPLPTKTLLSKWVILFAVLFAFALNCSVALAAPAFVILTVTDKNASGDTLGQHLANWRHLGLVSDAQLLEGAAAEESVFSQLGILEFPDEAALEHWQQTGEGQLGDGVMVTVADALSNSEITPRNSSDSVFQVMQYDVMVPKDGFLDYIEFYQTPQLQARITAEIMDRFTNYYARPGSTAPWQSLLILEYRDAHAFSIMDGVKAEIAVRLKKQDARFKATNDAKYDIRNKTATTQSRWLELPPPDLSE